MLVCVSRKYKESQACRTEAEYAFQQRKKIVPILMEAVGRGGPGRDGGGGAVLLKWTGAEGGGGSEGD